MEWLSEAERELALKLVEEDPYTFFPYVGVRPDTCSLGEIVEALNSSLPEDTVEKIVSTPFFNMIGLRSIYPSVYDVLMKSDPDKVSFVDVTDTDSACRNVCFYIQTPLENLVVKGYQSFWEKGVVGVVDSIQRGPNVFYAGIEMVEEYLGDTTLPAIHPFLQGKAFGEMLRDLHSLDILYADAFDRHWRNKDGRIHMIDFGQSFVFNDSTPLTVNKLDVIIQLVEGHSFPCYLNPNEKLKEFANLKPEDLKRRELKVLKGDMHEVLSNSCSFKGVYDMYEQFDHGLMVGYNNLT